MKTIFKVKAGASVVYEGESLVDAIRAWDDDDITNGGIEVQSWNSEGLMVRDGWVLHVTPDKVYLNPRLHLELTT